MSVLFFVVFIDLVGFGIILPLQPFFAMQLGASDATVTLVASSFTAAQLVFAPFWGSLSDRVGRRRVLLVTIAGTAIGYTWLAFVDSLLMLFLARAFGGCMAANIGVAHAYVADVTAPETRARGMGRVGAAAGLGFVAGPAIGGLLAGADPANPAVHIPFLTAAGMSALAFVLAIAALRDTGTGRRGKREGMSIFSAARPGRGQLLLLIGLMFITPFVFTGVETTLALWSEDALGWGARQNGWMYTFMGAVAVTAQGLLVGPLVGRLGERRTILTGAACACAGAVLLPFSTGYAILMAALGLIVFGMCVTGPSMNSLISAHAAAGDQGRMMGIAQRSGGLGRVVGPAWAGAGFEHVGREWPYFSGAVMMVAMLLIARRIAPYRPSRGP